MEAQPKLDMLCLRKLYWKKTMAAKINGFTVV